MVKINTKSETSQVVSHHIDNSSQTKKEKSLFDVLSTVWEAIKNFFRRIFSSTQDKTELHNNDIASSSPQPPPPPLPTVNDGKTEEEEDSVLKEEKKCPFLEEVEKLLDLNPPKIRFNPKQDKSAFIEKMEKVLMGIINEEVTLTIEFKEQTVRGKIESPDQFHQAFKLIEKQLRLFNQLPNLPDECHIDINVFEDLKQLVNVWSDSMCLISKDLDIQGKIKLLKKISDSLPEKECDIWKKYPQMLKRIQDNFNIFKESLFSPYVFEANEFKGNQEQFKIDSETRATLNKFYMFICKKLGEESQIPEIDMYTEDDKQIAKEIQEEEKVRLDTASEIIAICLQKGPESAATLLLNPSISKNKQFTLAQEIISEIGDSNIRNKIANAFSKLLFPEKPQ